MKERLIHIHTCRGVTWSILKKFMTYDPSLKNIFALSKQDFKHYFAMKDKQLELFFSDLHSKDIYTNILKWRKKNIHIVTVFDERYPRLLKEIYDPPWVLYGRGDISLLASDYKLSVVGTRTPSKNGLLSLEKILSPLIAKGWIIVSGLAIGIDARSHTFAIQNKGKTIAVLASGFDYIYPHCHQKLASIISEEHLLLSEHPPDRKPQKWFFPMRNRIISGLSKGTLIIEAKQKSGSLITADMALQQGREVFAVPGSILDERTEGTHWLIQQGAKLTKCSNDVLNEW